MDKKAKILMSLALIASIGCVSGVAYAAYSVSSDGASTILPISVSNIQVVKAASCIEYVGIANKLKVGHQADGIISDDVLSIKYNFNEKKYIDSTSSGANLIYSYMNVAINMPNQTLYDHVKNTLNAKNIPFLSLNGRSTSWVPTSSNCDYTQYKNYTTSAKNAQVQSFSFDDAGKTLNIVIPTASDMSAAGGLYLRNVFNKNDVDSRTRIWSFNINFDFNIYSQGAYNTTLTSSIFQGVNIKTTIGQFQ